MLLEANQKGAVVEHEEVSTAMVVAVALHGLAICAATAGAVLATDSETYEQATWLIGGDPPGRFVALGIIYVLCLAAFAAFSALDFVSYRVEEVTITGIGLAFGGIACILGGVFCAVAALAFTSAVFWLWLIAFFASCIVYALQCAGVVVGLVRVAPAR